MLKKLQNTIVYCTKLLSLEAEYFGQEVSGGSTVICHIATLEPNEG